ncbi:MAG: ATP-binding protein [Rhodospirillales bacterium]|nr:ATP-binding protein [Rhodospirillales bacterium]
MARKYKMKISRLTVDKLGVKLYDRASAVVAELISNSYDADATQVGIEAPMGLYLATRAGGKVADKGHVIKVVDNGIGMTPDELQAYYLIIGAERRKDPNRGELSPKFKRRVTGRKGVGKLAPFGICKIIEVISSGGTQIVGFDANGTKIKGYLTSHVILNYDDIVDDDDGDYVLKTGKLDGTVTAKSGTTTILRNFMYRRVPEMEVLARQTAQRFGIPSANWNISLRDNTQTASAPGAQMVVGNFDVETMPNTRIQFDGPDSTTSKGADPAKWRAIGPDNKVLKDFTAGFEHEGKFYPLRGWVGYSKVPYKDDLMAGVRVYCRGKIAAQTSVFGRKAGFTGEHSIRSYLVGELYADWLDEDEDLIQTDRRDILWSDDVAAAFQVWGQKVVAKIGTLSRDPMRQTTKDRFFEVSDVVKLIDTEFPGQELKEVREQAVELAGMLGKTMSSADVEDKGIADSFAQLTLLLAPHLTLDEKLREAAANSSSPMGAVTDILRTARLAELASFGRIADDRIRVIDRLNNLTDAPDTVEDDFQKLIQEAPWLVNPQWAPITANMSLTTLRTEFEKYYKKHTGKDIYLGEFTTKSKRPDFVLSSQDAVVQIIEIKRPDHKIINTEMDRIITYDEQMKAFLDDPAHPDFKTMFNDYHITLVADGPNLTGAQKLAYDAMRKDKRLTLLSWGSFLAKTKKMHEAYLKEAARQRKLVAARGGTNNEAA